MNENENVSNERLERITRVYRPLYYALRYLNAGDLRAELASASERIEELESQLKEKI